MTDISLSIEQTKKLVHVNLDSYNEFGLRCVAAGIVDYLLENTNDSYATIDMSEVVTIVMNGGRGE